MEALKLLKEEAERKRKALNENRLKVRQKSDVGCAVVVNHLVIIIGRRIKKRHQLTFLCWSCRGGSISKGLSWRKSRYQVGRGKERTVRKVVSRQQPLLSSAQHL